MKTYEEMIDCEARMEIADKKKIRENFLDKHEVTRLNDERWGFMNAISMAYGVSMSKVIVDVESAYTSHKNDKVAKHKEC